MSDNTIDRKTLLSLATMLRPALASAAYIPALTHICFDDGKATAFNDIAAIWARAKFDYEGCLPGELLIKALNSFSNDTVRLQKLEDGATLLTCGRSKLKLPTLPVADYPVLKIKTAGATYIDIDASILKGIQMCMMNVGNDPTHPAQMGVTLDVDDKGRAVLFSTDNATISRYQTSTKIELPADAPVILPTFFCQQLCALAGSFVEAQAKLMVGPDFLIGQFGDESRATIFSRVMVDLEALDFAKQIAKIIKLSEVKDLLCEIPSSWEAAWQRALLVMEGEADKMTTLAISGDVLKLQSSSSMGEADDRMGFDGPDGPAGDPMLVDPSLIVRASKHVSKVAFTDKVTILSSEDYSFLHFIAHCSK